jgi:hypothetical protein
MVLAEVRVNHVHTNESDIVHRGRTRGATTEVWPIQTHRSSGDFEKLTGIKLSNLPRASTIQLIWSTDSLGRLHESV